MTISHLSTSILGNELIFIESVLFNTPCDLPGLATAAGPCVAHLQVKIKSEKKKKKDHESLVSD